MTEAILDSGASVTVIPPHVANGYAVQESAASKAGVQYELASGKVMVEAGKIMCLEDMSRWLTTTLRDKRRTQDLRRVQTYHQ